MAEYRDHYEEFRAAGASLVAISVDDARRSSALIRDLNLPFPVLSDTRRKVVQAYGRFNGGEKGGIAYPAVFVIARDGIVRSRLLEDIDGRADVSDLVALARATRDSGANQIAPRTARVRPGVMFLRAIRNALRFGMRQR